MQELLGHNDMKTTMIDTHVLNRGGRRVTSPLDELKGVGRDIPSQPLLQHCLSHSPALGHNPTAGVIAWVLCGAPEFSVMTCATDITHQFFRLSVRPWVLLCRSRAIDRDSSANVNGRSRAVK